MIWHVQRFSVRGAPVFGRRERSYVLVQRSGVRVCAPIIELVPLLTLAPVAAVVMAVRGVSVLVTDTVVAEAGNFRRFGSARQLMAYLGFNPPEHSSGVTSSIIAD